MSDLSDRDWLIITKALAYAIAAIDKLPMRQRALSDQADMKRILTHMVENDMELDLVIASAHRYLNARTG